jgi:hypothetical protein
MQAQLAHVLPLQPKGPVGGVLELLERGCHHPQYKA